MGRSLLYFCIHLRHRHREHNQRLERLRLVFQHCLHIRTGRQLPHILFSAATATYYCGHGHIHIECTHTAIPQSGGWGCGKGRYARDNEDPRRISFVHWRSTRGALHQPEQRLPGVVQPLPRHLPVHRLLPIPLPTQKEPLYHNRLDSVAGGRVRSPSSPPLRPEEASSVK